MLHYKLHDRPTDNTYILTKKYFRVGKSFQEHEASGPWKSLVKPWLDMMYYCWHVCWTVGRVALQVALPPNGCAYNGLQYVRLHGMS
jgi:hypothetical protein